MLSMVSLMAPEVGGWGGGGGGGEVLALVGAGACLFLPNEERVDLKQPVSGRSSILLGELVAIKTALESIKL